MKKRGYFYHHDVQHFEQLHHFLDKLKDHELTGNRGVLAKMRDIEKINEYLYLLNKLRLYARKLTYNAYLNDQQVDLPTNSFDLLASHIELQRELVNNVPVLYAYVEVTNFIGRDHSTDVTPKYIFALISMIKEFSDDLSDFDYLDLLSLITNWCTKAINLGQVSLRTPLFYAQVLMVNHGRDLEGNKYVLPIAIFKNMIITGVSYKDDIPWPEINLVGITETITKTSVFKWAKAVISEYKKYLVSPEKNSYIKFCEAYLLFWQNEYIQCYEKLLSIESAHRAFINIDIKKLLLMTLYEIERDIILYPKKRAIKQELVTVQKVKDSYRQQLKYFEKEKGTIGYLIEYHQRFLKDFGELFRFYHKYHGLYKSSESTIAFLQKKNGVIKRMEANPYPFSQWIVNKLKEIR